MTRTRSIIDPNQLFNAGSPVLAQLVIAADPFNVQTMRVDERQETIIRIYTDCGAYLNEHLDVRVSHSHLASVGNIVTDLVQRTEVGAEDFKEFLTDKLGDYPFARWWMMKHLGGINLTGGRTIPGWAWPKFQNAHPNKKALKDEWGLVDKNMPTVNKPKPKKKAASVRPQAPKAVRKPKCPIHGDTEMGFNVIRNVWECPNEFCNQIAVPRRERVEGNVLIGKGQVDLRFVFPAPGEGMRVILISDDNVALDITDFVDVEELDESYDISEAARNARDLGLPETTVRKVKLVIEATGVTVMGVDNAE